jgi:hypothetical protein
MSPSFEKNFLGSSQGEERKNANPKAGMATQKKTRMIILSLQK